MKPFHVGCKHCGKSTFLGFGMPRHWKKEHGIALTRRDKKMLWKYRARFALLPLWAIVKGIQWLLIFACLPFHFLYEILTGLR